MSTNFNTELYTLINNHRVSNGRIACQQDALLENAAGLHIEWLAASMKKQVLSKYPKVDHNTNTRWLLQAHPELRWDYLYATFPNGLPEQLSAFDLARLSGFQGGFLGDTGYFGHGKLVAATVFQGWKQSPSHNRGLLWLTMRFFGLASGPIGGQTAAFCFLSEPIQVNSLSV